MSQRIFILLFLVTILFGSNVPRLGMASPEGGVRYVITIDNTSEVLTVEAYFSGVDDSQLTFTLRAADYFERKGVPLTVTLLETDGNVLEKEKYGWTIQPNGDSVYLKYKIEGYTLERIAGVPGDIKHSGVSTTMAILNMEAILAVPYDKRSYRLIDEYLRKPATVEFNIPDNWETFAPFHVSSSNVIRVNMVYDILRSFIEMGEVSIKYTGEFYGVKTNYVLFKRPNLPRNAPNRPAQMPYLFSDMDRRKEAERLMRDTAHHFHVLSQLLDYVPAEEITITPAASGWIYGRGWWQIDDGFRQDQIAHHVVHEWCPPVIIISQSLNGATWVFCEGPAVYYGFKLAYNYTHDRRFLGKYYALYLMYKRGIQERLSSGNDPLYQPTLSYGYTPLLLWYFDEEIRKQTDNQSSLDTVFRYLVRTPYKDINVDEFITAIKESTGVDFSEFYYNHAIVDFSLPLDAYAEKYRDDFAYLLDFQRKNNEAPDILYYALLEMEAKYGNPDLMPILPHSYLKGDYLVTGPRYLSFIRELASNYPLTESKFVEILNKYTEGRSSDFFEFYTKYGPRPPSIESLNLWITGDYSRLVRKSVYIDTLINRLARVVPKDSEYYNLLATANSSYLRGIAFLDTNKFNEAEEKFNESIRALDELYALDLDNDGARDVSKLFLGLSTASHDSDGDGTPDKDEVAGKFSVDGVGDEWEGHGVAKRLSVTWGSREYVKDARLYRDGAYIYGKIELSKPVYDIERYAIVFRLDFDGDWGTFDDTVFFPLFTEFSFWGTEFNYGGPYYTWGCMNEYEVIHNNTIEFRIPVKTVEEYYDYFSSYIPNVSSSIPASIVFVKLDAYLNTDWGKTAGMDFNLELNPATLSITSDPSEAEVYVNGAYGGVTPLTLTLDPGTYQIKLSKEDYEDYTTTVTLKPGENRELSVTLTPAFGHLTVYSDPPGADVYVDGAFVGATPLEDYKLSTGQHELKVVKEGYEEYSTNITITAGKTFSTTSQLKPIPTTTTTTSKPIHTTTTTTTTPAHTSTATARTTTTPQTVSSEASSVPMTDSNPEPTNTESTGSICGPGAILSAAILALMLRGKK
ncbi:PEGA domain-containing protein [Palaeococcus ferrophilus]|uniref:PEGA domain-containing protein n=1 Tax=Palaeococcus ferrophilus TaxID=83868 RepID=UPI00064E2094|nr:PEGA domain-containing protein [Palaeococcus ferrophilus]